MGDQRIEPFAYLLGLGEGETALNLAGMSVFKFFETLSGFSCREALARLRFQIRRLFAGGAIAFV